MSRSTTTPEAAEPLLDEEIDEVGRLLLDHGHPRLLLAVSGGVDSMALMHIASRCVSRAGRGELVVATVDHGLRHGSTDDARFVMGEARRLGLKALMLRWEGEKPASGIQAAARKARYTLLRDACSRESCTGLVTAHTEDDQAETFLMRLARGSGVDGLSGMRPADTMPPASQLDVSHPHIAASATCPVSLLRPFLGFPKARLVATMLAGGHPWIEDPSNENLAFERVRIRRALASLSELGLKPSAIATSARRLASARAALEHAAIAAIADPSLVTISPIGYVTVSREMWTHPEKRLPGEIVLRVLAAAIRMTGGSPYPVSLQSLESVARSLDVGWTDGAQKSVTTLARAKVIQGESCVTIVREEGREPPPETPLAPGETIRWDNRFVIRLLDTAPHPLSVRALGQTGCRLLRELGLWPRGVPLEAMRTAPSLWRDGQLQGVSGIHASTSTADPVLAGVPPMATDGPWQFAFESVPSGAENSENDD